MITKRFLPPRNHRRSHSPWGKKAATALLALVTVGYAPQSWAATASHGKDDPNAPTLLVADSITNDEKSSTVKATGHVEISKAGKVLRADEVTYFQDNDVVRAKGNVVLLQPSGDTLFADETELTSDMADGFIEKVSILFADNSRIAAMNAQRYDSRYVVAQHGLYSACNLCEDNPRDPPIWQLRAEKITDDAETQNIIYRDATVEVAGVPVLYTPYFSHPEPSVKRREGFLTPTGGSSPNLGLFARTPYYFDLAPETDLTVTPTFSANDGAQIAAEWRQRFAHTSMQWTGSFTRADLVEDDGTVKGQQFRGSLFGSVLYNYDAQWRAGTNIALTTDKSYLSRYSIAHDDVLVNQAFIEGFKGRNYNAVNLYYFEDIRPGTQLQEPIVTPEITVSRLGEPGKTFGGRWSFDASTLITTRDNDTTTAQQGPDTRRLSLNAGWDRSVISSSGLVTDLSATTRNDSYWADNIADPDNSGNRYDTFLRTRPFAQGDVTLHYPMGRRGDGYEQMLEPIVRLTAAPRVSQEATLPNEDSLAVEFDETNLFAKNRFTGNDRIEGGNRATYGLRQSVTTDGGGRVELVAGQVYRFSKTDQFDQASGMQDKASDYVGRVDFVPAQWADLNYGFMLDKNNFTPTRQEVRGSAGVPLFRPFVNYLSIENTIVNGVASPLEEITGGFSSTFAKYYTVVVSQNQAFRPDPGVRSRSIALNYRDECFTFGVTAQHNSTTRTDVSSGDSVIFHFYLKNIGGLQTDSVTSPSYYTKDQNLVKTEEQN